MLLQVMLADRITSDCCDVDDVVATNIDGDVTTIMLIVVLKRMN